MSGLHKSWIIPTKLSWRFHELPLIFALICDGRWYLTFLHLDLDCCCFWYLDWTHIASLFFVNLICPTPSKTAYAWGFKGWSNKINSKLWSSGWMATENGSQKVVSQKGFQAVTFVWLFFNVGESLLNSKNPISQNTSESGQMTGFPKEMTRIWYFGLFLPFSNKS